MLAVVHGYEAGISELRAGAPRQTITVSPHPNDILNDAGHWRKSGEEMRALANDIGESEAQATMPRITAEYELLALRAAERTGKTVRATWDLPPKRSR
jgi:hypothetical protein